MGKMSPEKLEEFVCKNFPFEKIHVHVIFLSKIFECGDKLGRQRVICKDEMEFLLTAGVGPSLCLKEVLEKVHQEEMTGFHPLELRHFPNQ